MKYIHTIKGSLINARVNDFTPSEFKTNEVQKFEYQGFFKFFKFAFLKSPIVFGICALWAAVDIVLAHNAFMWQGIFAGFLAAMLITKVKIDGTITVKKIRFGTLWGVFLTLFILVVVGNGLYYGFGSDSSFVALFVQSMWIFMFSYMAYFVKFFRAYKTQKLLTDKHGNCYIAI